MKKMSNVSPPVRFEDVTPAWLTTALADTYPDVEVRGATFGPPIHGTGTNMSVTLDYAVAPGTGESLPERMWLKSCYEPHFTAMAPSRVYEMEAMFYRELAARLPVRVPHCYYAGADPVTHQGAVLLEDLAQAGVKFGDARAPITPDLAAQGLDLLAQLHAATWGQTWPRDMWYVTPGIPLDGERGEWFAEQTPEVFARYLVEREEANTPAAVADPARIVKAFRALAAMSQEGPCCLIHSDAHLDNFYFDAQGAGLMDWQAPRYGSWAWDVSYFLISALDIPVRRSEERALLGHYLRALSSAGVEPPDADTAWLAYRRYNAYGLFVKIVNPDIFKPRSINLAWMSRHVAATKDLETFESLGV